MITQIFAVVALAATANAGLAVSYANRGIEGGLGLGRGLIGGLERGIEDEEFGGGRILLGGLNRGIGIGEIGEERIGLRGGLIGKERVVVVYAPPKYEFKYGVGDPKTGDRKEQAEARVGDVVRGEYSLAEPDGTIRVVKYEADDKNGFNAVVKRIGKALHPQVLLTKGIGLEGRGLGIEEFAARRMQRARYHHSAKIQRKDFEFEVPPLLYNSKWPLKKPKYNNVMTLADQYVPENDKGFYQNLTIGPDTDSNETDYTDDDDTNDNANK